MSSERNSPESSLVGPKKYKKPKKRSCVPNVNFPKVRIEDLVCKTNQKRKIEQNRTFPSQEIRSCSLAFAVRSHCRRGRAIDRRCTHNHETENTRKLEGAGAALRSCIWPAALLRARSLDWLSFGGAECVFFLVFFFPA